MAEDSRLIIAVFIPGFRAGGAERAMLRFARGSLPQGYPADILVAQAEGPFGSLVPETANLDALHD